MRRALIIAPGWIGDALLAAPLFARLHDQHPGLVLDALAPRGVGAVLRRMPPIAQVLPAGVEHGELGLGKRRAQARAIRDRRYDAAYILPNSFKSALVPWLAGIPLRVGYTGECRLGLINRRHRLDRSAVPLMAERYAQLAEPPGTTVHRPLARPRLRVDGEHRARRIEALGLDLRRPVIAFCPGAEFGAAKRWPADHFAQLARSLSQSGHAVWLFGSAKDCGTAAQITAASGGACTDLTGRTTLEDVIDLMSCAQAAVANDSGLMHIAAATGCPVVGLYGSTSPLHTPPLSERSELLWLGLECSPCFKRDCPLGHFHCMEHIRPEQVLQALDRLRAQVPAAAGCGGPAAPARP